MTPTRIALIQSFLPSRSQGGAGHFAHGLAVVLAHRGHEITIVSLDPAPQGAPYAVLRPDPDAVWLKSTATRLHGFPIWAGWRDYSSFEVVHAMGDSQFMRPGVPVVRTLHGSSLAEARHARRWRGRLMYLSIYPFEVISSVRARRSVAVSRYTSRHFPGVVDVIPNGVDLSVFRPAGPKSARPSVLAVGHRLHDRKRLDLLLEVFQAAVRPRLPEAELWLVCDEKVESAGVRSFSALPGEDLARLYREAWVFCLPSSYEGFGRPYIEALASGTAVVATPNPGALEVLGEGTHGVLAEPSELGTALVGLLEDGQRRTELEECGLARAQAYAWDRVADRYEEIYESVRAARARTVPR